MNLNILTSGLITSKFGIRPALMCATRTDLSQHSVVRIISAKASGWIGIANGNLITGAKCQSGDTTLNGFEALSVFMKLESGAFDLIQMDSRLLGDELAQSIGISIDELLDKLRQTPDLATIEILRKCKRNAIPEIDSKLPAPPTRATPSTASDELDVLINSIDDADWDLGDEGVIESLERQTSGETNVASLKEDLKATPSSKVEEKAAPKVEEKAAPKVEGKAAPQGEEKAVPKVEEKAAPQVEEKAAPKVEEKAAPKVEAKAAPKVTSDVPKFAEKTPEKKSSEIRDKTADLFAPDESQVNRAIKEPDTVKTDPAQSQSNKAIALDPAQSQSNKAIALDPAQSQTNKALDSTLSQSNKAAEEQGGSLLDSLAQVWGWAKKTTAEAMSKDKKSTKEVETPKITWEPSDTETSVKRTGELSSPASGETVVVKRTQEQIELTPVAKRKTSEIAMPAPDAGLAEVPPQAEPVDEDIHRFGQLSAMQDAAFGNASLNSVPETNNAGFVLVSPGESGYSGYQPEAYPDAYQNTAPPAASADGDLLGSALRAELQAFVRQKFGEGEEKVFEDVHLEDTKDYQQSLVLRDLEAAISGKPKNELVRVEREEEEAPPQAPAHQSTFDKLKSQALTQSMQTSQLTSEIQRAKSASLNASGAAPAPPAQGSKIEQEREQSRSLFVEQVRKSVEVDAKSFVANQNEDTKYEISILKDKRLKHFIIVGSSIGIVLSIVFFTFHSAQRQTSLTAASDKLVAGDLKGAKEAYEAIIAANPQSWEAYLGHALSVPTDYKRQVEDYKKVLTIKPEEFSAAQALAKAELELKRYGDAIEASDKAFKIKENCNSLMIKADALMKLGRWDTAASVLEKAAARDDGDKARIYSLMADCYAATNDKNKQADALIKALACDSKNVDFAKKLAILKLSQGDTVKGREYLNKALVLSPGDGELHYHHALLIKNKEPDKAIEELTKAIEHNFDEPEAFAERGMLYFQKRQYGPAKPDLEEALSKKPSAKLQKIMDQTDKEIALMKSRAGTRTLKDENTETPLTAADLSGDYVGRAYEQAKAGNLGYAIKVLRAAVKTNPGDARARRYLANTLYSAGDYVSASTQFAYAAASGLSLEEQYFYGKALVKANRLEGAVKVLQNLVQQQPTFTKARIELIKAYTLAGFNDHAREECQIGMQSARNQQEYTEFKSMMP